MHSIFFLIGILVFITGRHGWLIMITNFRLSASYSQGQPNEGSQMGGQGAPMFMHMHAPVMYSVPLMATAPLSAGRQDGMSSPRSGFQNLMGSYAGGKGHHSHIFLELPFRRARARKLAARMRKNLKKHHKFN
ncbi:hypothetical protein ANCCAN_12301 [Ancylostoma caninum]|uniref:Uncharacterized protein n=1 Tax=Ancylostoma caninum TaxID=29170 RepID=A0A368GFD7_ANCCA|nr:hypothetical protein ANCCAN_12301 [Ancylostoma caninum]